MNNNIALIELVRRISKLNKSKKDIINGKHKYILLTGKLRNSNTYSFFGGFSLVSINYINKVRVLVYLNSCLLFDTKEGVSHNKRELKLSITSIESIISGLE